ncbi:MAG: cell division protein FtsZ [Ruminococcus sp.]|jgi:cell division protein FtsZ|nr:cell division protein FtsZ [Ruminococcus sp.]
MANFTLADSEGTSAKTNIKVIGVGGAGGNAMNAMIEQGIKDVEFIAVNTDYDALQRMNADVRVQIGEKLTKGLGAGGKPETGRDAAEESIDELSKALKGANMVFIAAGMGGGTGTGAAPVVARLAKEMGILTVAFVTTPFRFEGSRKMRLAEAGIAELRGNIDSLIIVPNQKLLELETLTMREGFERSNQVLRDDVKSVAEIITVVNYSNIDFADIRSTMQDSGIAHMAIGRGNGKDRAMEAAQSVLSSPLLETSLKGAKRIIINILMSPDTLLDDVDKISSIIEEQADPDVMIIPGYGWDENMKEEIEVVVIATDFPRDEETKSGVTKVETDEKTPVITEASVADGLNDLLQMFSK